MAKLLASLFVSAPASTVDDVEHNGKTEMMH